MAVTIGGGNGGALAFTATLNSQQMTTAIQQLQNQLNGLTTSATSNANAISNLVQKTSAALAAYATFSTATNFIGDIVRVRGEFQQLEVAFNTMLGSKEKADKLLAEAVELAAKTPFTLQDVGTGAKQLLAYGFAADKVTDNLTTLGNIAAGVGAPLGDIVYLYGTLKTQGRAYTRDILQFTSRGIPIISELAKQFGVTEENVQKLVEGGKVGFPEVERAFNNLTSSGGMFFNLMQEQSKTLTGLTSNLSDAWANMLNEIGKSNEGLFTDAIKGAISLVENYQEVLKVIELLIAAYGSYRAAIIITNAVNLISTFTVKGYTIAENLRAVAIGISDRAMKLLNATMLANPTTAVIAGILALASAIYLLKKSSVEAASASELLADAEKRNKITYEEKSRSIQVYVDALQKSNITESEKIALYEKIKAIDPVLVEGITAQTISYDLLRKNVDKYLDSLRNKLALEANSEGVTASIKKEQELQAQYDKTAKTIEKQQDLIKGGFGNISIRTSLDANIRALANYNAQLKAQQATTKEILEKGLPKVDANTTAPSITKTNKQLIDETKSLEVLEALRKNIQEEYEKSNDQSQRRILAADLKYADARRKILDVYGAAKQGAKEQESLESRINTLLEKRKGILEDIDSLQRGAKQSGLLKEQSEIDKVNEKYDIAIQKIEEFNNKAAEFNKKNPGAKVAAIGLTDISDLNKARLQETTNVTLKANADAYLKSLQEQKDVFSQFEDAKKDIGIEKAREMYAGQTQGFESYVKFLEAEAAKLIPKVLTGTANISDSQKLIGLQKEISAAREDQAKRDFAQQKSDYLSLIQLSETFDLKRKSIDQKYNMLYSTLSKERGKMSKAELDARFLQLQEAHKNELDEVTHNELEKSDAYKQFAKGFDKIGIAATAGIIKGLKALRDQMKAMGKDIVEINHLIDTASLALNEKSVSGIRDAAGLLRSAFADMNIQVAGQLKITASQISNALDSVATLLSKDSSKGQQVGSIIGLISFVIVGIRDALLTAKDLADPLQAQKDYYSQISNEIAASNELLLRQKNILEDLSGLQKVQLSANYLDDLKKKQEEALKSLQEFRLNVIKSSKEIYVDPVFGTEVSTGGLNALADIFLYGGQAKRKVKLDLQVVDTSQLSTIEEYAKLLNEIKAGGGKLNGKTVVEEDIKSLQLLIDTYDETVAQQKEFKLQFEQLLTGTTANSITDSIVDGFRNGLRSAKDFADNFQELMKNAVFQSLKIQALEGPLKVFYEEFAKSTASDDVLTEDEIRQLKDNFNGIISEAGKKFDQLQQITKLDLSSNSASAQANSLKGQIKGITEDQAQLLAGQFGGLRLTALDHLNVSRSALQVLNAIQANTSYLVTYLPSVDRRLANFELNGLKMR